MKSPVTQEQLKKAKLKGDNVEYQRLLFQHNVWLRKERDKDREKWKKSYMKDYREQRKKDGR